MFANLALADDIVDLPDIVVTTQAAMTTQLNSSANITTLNNKAIAQAPEHTLSNLLQATAGIETNDLYGDDNNLNLSMRGFGDNSAYNSLILIDGVPLLNSDLSSPDLMGLDLSQLKRIEILPGSAGVLYGDQAVGGVVNLITTTPQAASQKIIFSLGSYNTTKQAIQLSDILPNEWSYNLFGSHLTTDNFRQNNNLDLSSGGMRFNYQGENKVYIELRGYDRLLGYPGALTAAQVMQDPTQAQTPVNFGEETGGMLRAGIIHPLNDAWKLQLDSAYSQSTGYGVLTIPFTDNRSSGMLLPKLIGETNWNNRNIKTILGLDLWQGDYNYNSSSYQAAADMFEHAIYGQVTIPLNSRLDLITGARWAGTNNDLTLANTNLKTSPQVGITNVELSWQQTQNLRYFIRRAGSYRFAKPEEQALSLNNQPLAPQTGVSYETGLDWKQQRNDLAASIYQLDLNNEIIFIPALTGPTLGFNQNLPPTRRQGFVLTDGYQILPPWKITANYNYVNARFSSGPNAGNQIPFVAANSVRIGNTYVFDPQWSMTVDGIYLGRQYPGGDVANVATPLGGYTIYNASVNYQVKNYNWALQLNNITNKLFYNYAVAYYNNGSASSYYYPAALRNILLTLTIQL